MYTALSKTEQGISKWPWESMSKLQHWRFCQMIMLPFYSHIYYSNSQITLIREKLEGPLKTPIFDDFIVVFFRSTVIVVSYKVASIL